MTVARRVVVPAHWHPPNECAASMQQYRRHVPILGGPRCGDDGCFAEENYPLDDSHYVILSGRTYVIMRPIPGSDEITELQDQEALG